MLIYAFAKNTRPGTEIMATNANAGDNHRNGAVRKQLKTKVMGEDKYTKRSEESGQFLDQTKTAKKFKGVRKEK